MASSVGEADRPNIGNASTSYDLESQLTLYGLGNFSHSHVKILQDTRIRI